MPGAEMLLQSIAATSQVLGRLVLYATVHWWKPAVYKTDKYFPISNFHCAREDKATPYLEERKTAGLARWLIG